MIKHFYKLAIILILLLQSSGYPQFWDYQISGTTQHLNGVYMLDTQTGWICGNAGTLLKTTNGGQNWTQVNATANDLNSVLFKDANIGVAVGDNGTIIRTINGGANWSVVASGTTEQFRKVSSGSGNTFFAAGDNGLISVSTDNGATWNLKNAGTTLRLKGTAATASNKVWIAGENGVIKYSADGGSNWSDQTSGITNNDINDIQFINESIGFAGADGSNFIFTTDGGQNWAPRNSGIFFDMEGIYFQDANIGWGVSIVGTIFFTTDGGSSWSSQPCGSAFTLREAHFLHQGKGWTVGDNGTVVMYTDNTVPVELNSFSAYVTGNNVSLKWSTATETNNSGFQVERRSPSPTPSFREGTFDNWENIGFVDGHGTSTEQQSYLFNDDNLSAGKYMYRIKQIDFDGSFEYYELASEVTVEAPNTFSLSQNYPNPFNPTTLIQFSIPVKGNVTLKVYDIIGNEVATLVNENKEAGVSEVRFNGEGLSSGLYLYQLKSSTFIKTMKMTLIK
jgi:photosystem II stability/assembly factor-like uncharacterized protein